MLTAGSIHRPRPNLYIPNQFSNGSWYCDRPRANRSHIPWVHACETAETYTRIFKLITVILHAVVNTACSQHPDLFHLTNW